MRLQLRGSVAAILLTLVLGAMAVVVAPAAATITPVISGLTASSNNASWSRSGLAYRCPTSTFVGRISADGRSASGEHTFSNAGRTTCTGTFGVSCQVTTAGRTPTTITLRSTASTAGASATFDLVYDANFTLEQSCNSGGLVCTISGPQTFRGAGTLNQGPPSILITNIRGIRCTEGGTADFTGTYTFVERLTVS